MTVSREELESKIADAFADYDDDVRAEWSRTRMEPVLWHRRSRGAEGERAWVIAVRDSLVLWFDDDEVVFAWSMMTSHGIIEDDGEDWDISPYVGLASIPHGIAFRLNEDACAHFAEGDVPVELAGPCTIVRTQLYYWDVRTESCSYRVHFRDVAEARVVEHAFVDMTITDVHPLLEAYRGSSRGLYFIGTAADLTSVADELERVLRALSSGWRGLRDYGSSADDVERRLRGRFGMLFSAPTAACHAAAAVLARHGVMPSVVGSDIAKELPKRRVLVLGRSAVVAAGFAFERLAWKRHADESPR